MIPVELSPFANHLWQSTLFAGVAALLTLALRKNRAHMRYWLWMAASVKFLVPFSLLVSAGNRIEWRTAPAVAPPLSSAIAQISQPFTLHEMPALSTASAPAASPLVPALVALWLIGCLFVLARWCARWRRARTAVRGASRVPIDAPVEVRSSATLLEPGVFGILRPVLLLPQGIADRLAPAQLRAVLEHELCHVRRRDNLAAAVHMLVEAIFWFHPLVWWIGTRMLEERERACDEEVLRLGNEPQAYAEGILNVCKFYVESPLACSSGVTGSDLKKRIEEIMTQRMSHRLTRARKLLLAAAAVTAVAGPIFVGILNAPRSQAQSKPELTFEVATIKPGDPDSGRVMLRFMPGGGLQAANMGLRELIAFAYNVPCGRNCENFISGGPGWIDSLKFDIVAKAPQSAETTSDPSQMTAERRKLLQDQARQRLRSLLAERFQLVVRRETKESRCMPCWSRRTGPS